MNKSVTYKHILILAVVIVIIFFLRFLWGEYQNYDNLKLINERYPIRCAALFWQNAFSRVSDNDKYSCVDKQGHPLGGILELKK